MANTHENLNYANNDMYVVYEWLWTIMTAGACIVLSWSILYIATSALQWTSHKTIRIYIEFYRDTQIQPKYIVG